MPQRDTLFWIGFGLALCTTAFMLVLEVSLGLAASVLLLWGGSLWLTHWAPPEVKLVERARGFDLESLGQIIENSHSPVLITENDRVALANRAARRDLGRHVIGQDARLAFRHPEAVALIESKSSGQAVIHNVARRRDQWLFARQQLASDIAVIELVNQTAQQDIGRAHTDFVANASHELRTPLASIIGYVETLQEQAEDVDPAIAQRFLGTIQSEAKRLQNLVSDLMSLSRVEAEKHDPPADIVDFGALVRQAAHDAAGLERTARLAFELADDVHVIGDPRQLEQLVRNLVDNALKYGTDGTPVTVTLDRAAGEYARLTVRDRGEGIAREHLPHLTRRFYRTNPSRSRASGGTGLGLAIVKHIVERHSGRLDITSELGEGTTVVVRIPEHSPVSAAA
ncbi:ATP-binding protein [Qipengyuania sp. JC766]|uniref:sensor histidine kinase n=1 Tax=Qipengyuania sp. JC766 TaxID=3232139 RepID=UPI0034590D5E